MPGHRSAIPVRVLVLYALLASPATAVAQNPQPFKDWANSTLADPLRQTPRVSCAAVISLTDYDVSILSATTVPAQRDVPEFCRVVGQIQPEVRFELSLPAVWNGRLYMFGNGGYAGESLEAPARVAIRNEALKRGFAAVQTNTGHDAAREPLGTFATNQQKFIDYAFRAVHVTAVTAKRLSQAYYETSVRRWYFNGCSTGGRQGLMSAQRFPEDFDGILVGAPVLNLTQTQVSHLWNAKALSAAPVTADQLKIVADAVYGKCDALDGVADGVINDPRRCAFSPATDLKRCNPGQPANSCISAEQTGTLEKIYAGPTGNGLSLAPGWPVGSEISGASNAGIRSGWIPWFVAAEPTQTSAQLTLAESALKYMAFGKPNPAYDWRAFDFNNDPQRMDAFGSIVDATNPDLSRMRATGGKILMYFGWADPALNPLMGVHYYEHVTKTMGSETADFFRLYMVPGMFHCGGGVGTTSFDAFTPLVEWVEKGTTPAALPAARLQNGKVIGPRPLCPYPQGERYKGSGSTDDAANFSCVAPVR